MKLEAEITRAGYDEKTILLSNVNVKADEGHVLLIAGSSGSGKTTLLLSLTGVLKHLLNGIVDGSISINGLNPLILEDFEKLPGNISVLMQDPERQLIFPTPLDELSTSLEAIGYPHVEALKQASILLSEIGLSNKVNVHVEDLSSGERRKLTLALIQVGDPPIYMLDEPSANLDPQSIALVRDTVKKWKNNGKTVLIVEHKIHYFRDLADEMYVLRGGRLGEFFVINDMLVNLPECETTSSSEGEVVLEFEGDIGYNDTPIVRNAEFKARRGELISIVGPNGSGKTTFLKTLAGFLKPVDGGVKTFTKKYFYAPQNPDLVFVHRTVKKELESIARKTSKPLHELT
ncbi:MAG: ATP-binding cassette domain-containing protein, partial [Desulfurococcaceae archaeon]